MEANTTIRFCVLQKDIDSEPNVDTYKGSYRSKDGTHYISYESEGVRNLIKVTKDKVEVSKSGALVSRLEFRKGERTSSLTNIGEGELLTEVLTKEIKYSTSVVSKGEVFRLKLMYELAINGSRISDCDMELTCIKGTN